MFNNHITCAWNAVLFSGLLILILAIVSLGLAAIHGYFWRYDYDEHSCSPRPEVMEGGASSVWSVWSWITEMLIFAAVPFTILGLNFRVIVEVRRITKRHRESMCGLQLNPAPPGDQVRAVWNIDLLTTLSSESSITVGCAVCCATLFLSSINDYLLLLLPG
jgi:hypothetical protein